jgi:hypothetical protein
MVKIDVLTYGSGYSLAIYERFVGSLCDTGFKGNIYIVCSLSDKPNLTTLKKKYKNVYPLIDNLTRNHLPLYNHRYHSYDFFFNKINLDCDYMLICDTRDVLFQRNIEDYEYKADIDLYVFEEFAKLEQSPCCNIPWMLTLEKQYGEKFYNSIKHNKIICSGTTIGKLKSIKNYVKKQIEHLNKCSDKAFKDNKIADQGILNYLVYTNKLSNIKKMSNDDCFINTVGCDPCPKINDKNEIINKNGEVPYVVHQYDRFPIELKKKISEKYNFVI